MACLVSSDRQRAAVSSLSCYLFIQSLRVIFLFVIFVLVSLFSSLLVRLCVCVCLLAPFQPRLCFIYSFLSLSLLSLISCHRSLRYFLSFLFIFLVTGSSLCVCLLVIVPCLKMLFTFRFSFSFVTFIVFYPFLLFSQSFTAPIKKTGAAFVPSPYPVKKKT